MKASRIAFSPLTAIAVALLAISLIVVSRNGSLRAEHYFVKQTPVTAQVAWYRKGDAETPAKALVAIGYATQGWHGSRFRAFFSRVGETLGLTSDIPDFLEPSTELLSIEVPADGKPGLTKAAIPQLSSVRYRQLATHDGKLYVMDWRGYGSELDDEEDGEPVEASPAGIKGWRLDDDQFVEMTERETQSVSEAVGRERQRSLFQGHESALQNQSSGWQVCTENVYSTRQVGRCPMTLGGKSWTLRFNRANTRSLDGVIFAELAGSNNRETIRLTSDANVWTETDATGYSAQLNNSVAALHARSGTRFAGGWISYLFGILVALGVPYVLIRGALSQQTISKPYFPEVKPEDFPGLDQKRLEEYSRVLTANGFTHLRDFTLATPSPSRHRPPCFARLFVNADLGCFAEVGQIFTPQRQSAGMRCSFITSFNGDWRISTSDRVVNSVSYIARRPRSLWLSRPGMETTELLSLHCRMINQMKMQLSLTVIEDMSLGGYFQRSAQGLEELNKVLRKKYVWLFPLVFQVQYHNHRSHYEWLGDNGLKAPASSWTAPAKNEGNDSSPGWQRTINGWAPTINVVCTAMIGLSAYLMFFRPIHSANSSLFCWCLSVLGLSGYGLLAIAKKKSQQS